MAYKRTIKTWPRPSLVFALATTVLCCLVSCTQSHSLRKAFHRRSVDPEANYQEGKILFGNFFDQNGAQPDVVKSPFTEDAWDFQEGSPGLPLDPRAMRQWSSMEPSCQCAPNQMWLLAKEPGASQLALAQGDKSSAALPLASVPESCGYTVNQDSAGLELTVPYDGCTITEKDGRYLLPMLWQGIPIMLSCPKAQTSSPKGQQQVVHPLQMPTVTHPPVKAKEPPQTTATPPADPSFPLYQHPWHPAMMPNYQGYPHWHHMVNPPQVPTAPPTTSVPPTTSAPTTAVHPPLMPSIPLYQNLWNPAMMAPYQGYPYGHGQLNPPQVTTAPPSTVAPTTAAHPPIKGKDLPQMIPPAAKPSHLHEWNPLLMPPYHGFPYWPHMVNHPQITTAAPTTTVQPPETTTVQPPETTPPAADTKQSDLYQWNPLSMPHYHGNPYWQHPWNPLLMPKSSSDLTVPQHHRYSAPSPHYQLQGPRGPQTTMTDPATAAHQPAGAIAPSYPSLTPFDPLLQSNPSTIPQSESFPNGKQQWHPSLKPQSSNGDQNVQQQFNWTLIPPWMLPSNSYPISPQHGIPASMAHPSAPVGQKQGNHQSMPHPRSASNGQRRGNPPSLVPRNSGLKQRLCNVPFIPRSDHLPNCWNW
ncbi:mucin-2-like [Gadus chalcogrammus]|uniref:mucin-2-like n=1 Tax=Gadus chalcogrammus TaxID=1042646 RepID=UPI0024C224C5|nr:mucin-2-like [Gadus chalcogrammus]